MPYGAPYRRRARVARKPRRTVYKRRALPPRKKAATTKLIKRTLATMQETKVATHIISLSGTLFTYHYSNIAGGGLGFPGTGAKGWMVPNVYDNFHIPQNLYQDGRTGNAVTPKSFTLRGFIRSLQWDATTNKQVMPFEVHLLVYRNKQFDNGDPGRMVIKPDNSEGTIDGTAECSMMPWNRAEIIVYKHRVFRLRPMPMYQTDAPIDTDPPNSGEMSVPLNVGTGSSLNPGFRRFRVSLPYPKQLKYNDTGNIPANHYFTVAAYVVNGSGQTLSYNQVRAEIYAVATMRYTDG